MEEMQVPGSKSDAVPGLKERTVVIGSQNVPFLSGTNCLDSIAAYLGGVNADMIVVVTDKNVEKLYGDAVREALKRAAPTILITFNGGENAKSLKTVLESVESILEYGVTRNSILVSLGGGIAGNVTGVIASLLFRGVRLFHIPTTTMAAMDSAISLKQAVNAGFGKNTVGSYRPPTAVLIDYSLFGTLSDRDVRAGYCEMIKNCLAIAPGYTSELREIFRRGEMRSPAALEWLLNASLEAKTTVLRFDTYEQKDGLVLEYGHTVGHALELIDNRRTGVEPISHGDAIAIGCLVASQLSCSRGWMTSEEIDLHYDLIHEAEVDLSPTDEISAVEILAQLTTDNKRGYLTSAEESVPFVLLRAIGEPARTDGLPLTQASFTEVQKAWVDVVSRVRMRALI